MKLGYIHILAHWCLKPLFIVTLQSSTVFVSFIHSLLKLIIFSILQDECHNI
jgi:hypothetical protein